MPEDKTKQVPVKSHRQKKIDTVLLNSLPKLCDEFNKAHPVGSKCFGCTDHCKTSAKIDTPAWVDHEGVCILVSLDCGGDKFRYDINMVTFPEPEPATVEQIAEQEQGGYLPEEINADEFSDIEVKENSNFGDEFEKLVEDRFYQLGHTTAMQFLNGQDKSVVMLKKISQQLCVLCDKDPCAMCGGD